jgi:hypothetical protein
MCYVTGISLLASSFQLQPCRQYLASQLVSSPLIFAVPSNFTFGRDLLPLLPVVDMSPAAPAFLPRENDGPTRHPSINRSSKQAWRSFCSMRRRKLRTPSPAAVPETLQSLRPSAASRDTGPIGQAPKDGGGASILSQFFMCSGVAHPSSCRGCPCTCPVGRTVEEHHAQSLPGVQGIRTPPTSRPLILAMVESLMMA